MKKLILIYSLLSVLFIAGSCKNEAIITPSEDLGFPERFAPKADELPAVKAMYEQYNLWLRLGFKDHKEVTNAILVQDVNNRYGATPMDENMKPSAIMFVDTLLHNVSEDYARRVFPPEFFFVKTYNGSYWKQDISTLGRSRLIVCWPNERKDTQKITIPETHYYQDSVLTRMVWSSLSGLLAQRMETEIPGFESAGMPYDKGKAMDEISKEFPTSAEQDEREAAFAALAAERGFISAGGSRGYEQDLGLWINLLATESFENIKIKYLDTSEKRKEKYKVFTDYLKKEYNWDIQAAGNKYRTLLDRFPKPEPEPEPEQE